MAKILCVGDSCADILIPYGQALNKEDVSPTFTSGGACANTAVALGKLNASVSFLGRVGKDYYGLAMKEEFLLNHVNIQHLIIDDHCVTTQILVVVDKNGERTPFLMPKEKSSYLEIYPNDLSYDEDTEYIVTNSMMLFDDPAASSITNFLIEAKKKNIKIILDINYRIETRNKDRKYLDKVVEISDYLLGSIKDDFYPYTNSNNIDDVISKLNNKNRTLVLRNSEGSTVVSKDKRFYCPACKVKVIDTLGAGDSANAGFIFGLINQFPLEDCNKLGCLLGGYCVSGQGARHTPTLKELFNLIK